MTSSAAQQHQALQLWQPQAPATQRVFTRFSKLADELKLMIWKEAANLPRYVDMWTLPTFLHHHPTGPCRGWRYRSLTRVPGVLHACAMSRKEALKHYVLIGDVWSCKHRHRYYVRNMMYINWGVDTICPTELWAGWYADLTIPRLLFNYPLLRKIAINCVEYRDWFGQLPQDATDIMFYIVGPPLDANDFDFYYGKETFSLELIDFIPDKSESRLQSLFDETRNSLLGARWEDWPFRGSNIYPDNLDGDIEKVMIKRDKAHPSPNIKFKRVLINGVEPHGPSWNVWNTEA